MVAWQTAHNQDCLNDAVMVDVVLSQGIFPNGHFKLRPDDAASQSGSRASKSIHSFSTLDATSEMVEQFRRTESAAPPSAATEHALLPDAAGTW